MPEPAVTRPSAYAGQTDDEVARTLARLPTASQLAWIKVQPELLKDPVDHPRSRKLKKTIYIYSQPDPPLEVTYEVNNDQGTIEFMHFVAPQLQARSNIVVIVYNEKDKEWFDVLTTRWLDPLVENKLIEIWDVSQITAGANRQSEIDGAMGRARAALLLVTQDLIATDLKQDVFKLGDRLKTGNFEIQWILVKASLYKKTIIEALAPINDVKKPLNALDGAARDNAFIEIHNKIEKIAAQW